MIVAVTGGTSVTEYMSDICNVHILLTHKFIYESDTLPVIDRDPHPIETLKRVVKVIQSHLDSSTET